MSVDPASNNEINSDDRIMALLAYILGFFIGFVGPLVIYVVKKDKSPFVAYHALQAIIFHAVIWVGYAVGVSALFLAPLVWLAVGVLSLVFTIVAALAANRGEWFEIPVIGPFTRRQFGP